MNDDQNWQTATRKTLQVRSPPTHKCQDDVICGKLNMDVAPN